MLVQSGKETIHVMILYDMIRHATYIHINKKIIHVKLSVCHKKNLASGSFYNLGFIICPAIKRLRLSN